MAHMIVIVPQDVPVLNAMRMAMTKVIVGSMAGSKAGFWRISPKKRSAQRKIPQNEKESSALFSMQRRHKIQRQAKFLLSPTACMTAPVAHASVKTTIAPKIFSIPTRNADMASR